MLTFTKSKICVVLLKQVSPSLSHIAASRLSIITLDRSLSSVWSSSRREGWPREGRCTGPPPLSSSADMTDVSSWQGYQIYIVNSLLQHCACMAHDITHTCHTEKNTGKGDGYIEYHQSITSVDMEDSVLKGRGLGWEVHWSTALQLCRYDWCQLLKRISDTLSHDVIQERRLGGALGHYLPALTISLMSAPEAHLSLLKPLSYPY